MKRGLLVLAVLVLAASAWAGNLKCGSATIACPPSGGGSFRIDTLQYHSIFRDNRLLYIYGEGAGGHIWTATRFTPPYDGTIDSAIVVVYVPRAENPSPTDTLFFWRDTTDVGFHKPGALTYNYPWTFTASGAGAYYIKIRNFTAQNITNGVDFWAGYVGMYVASGDSVEVCIDTTTSTTPDRQYANEVNRTSLTNWVLLSSWGASFNKDWGISLFAQSTSGVELLTPYGSVSLPPRLYPASPNPLRGAGEIAFDLPKAARVELTVHDLAGRLVRTLVVGESSAGHHSVRWDGKDALGQTVTSGVYLYTLRAGNLSATRSLVIVR